MSGFSDGTVGLASNWGKSIQNPERGLLGVDANHSGGGGVTVLVRRKGEFEKHREEYLKLILSMEEAGELHRRLGRVLGQVVGSDDE